MPMVWLDLPNWLPDDPKFQSGEYKADVRSGKRAETWSGGCERGPGPTIVREVRNPANVMRRNVELAFREVVRYDGSKSK